ncbi:MAG: TolC family protein [Planctomycetaceae bacterium]
MRNIGIRLVSAALLVCSVVSLWSADARAQSAEPDPTAEQDRPAVTSSVASPTVAEWLHKLTELAQQHNPTVQQARANLKRVRGMRHQMSRYPNPTVGYAATEIGNEGRAGQQGLYFNQEFVTSGKLDLNDQIYGWYEQTAQWGTQVQELRVTGAVRQRYFDLLANRSRLSLLMELTTISEKSAQITSSLLEAGEIARGQELQAQLYVLRNRIAIATAQTALLASERRLVATIGTLDVNVSEIPGRLDKPLPPQLTFETTWQQMRATSPELKAAEADVTRAQWRMERERVEPIPNLNTSISAQYDFATQYTITTFQIGIPLPVYNKNRGRIQAAQAGFIRANHEVRRRELELRNRLLTTIYSYQAARNQAFKIEQDVLPVARESLQTTSKTFELGESSYQDLLTAQRSLAQSRLDAIEARRTVFQTWSHIDTYLLSDGFSAATQTALP